METVKSAEIINDGPDTVKSDLRKFNKTEDQVNKALAALSTVVDIKDEVELIAAMDIIKKAKTVDKLIEEKRVSLVKPYNDEVKRINSHAKELSAKLPPAIKSASDAVLVYNKKLQEEKIAIRTTARIQQLQDVGFVANYIKEAGKDETFFRLMRHNEFDLEINADVIQTAEDVAWPGMVQRIVDLINKKIQEKNEQLLTTIEADQFFGEETDHVLAEPVKPVEAPSVKHVPSFGSQNVKGITKRWTFSIVDPTLVPREYLTVDESKIRQAMNAGVRDIPGVKFEQTESLTSR